MASRADRAKIFLPFAALDGLEEALAELERIKAEKQQTVDETQVRLFVRLPRRSTVAVVARHSSLPQVVRMLMAFRLQSTRLWLSSRRN